MKIHEVYKWTEDGRVDLKLTLSQFEFDMIYEALRKSDQIVLSALADAIKAEANFVLDE